MEEQDKLRILSKRRIMRARRLALLSGGGNSGPSPEPGPDPLLWNGLKFTAGQDNSTITYTPSTATTAEYSLNGDVWKLFDNQTVTLDSGDTVCVRGVVSGVQTNLVYAKFTMTGSIAGAGSIMSLSDKDDWEGKTTITYNYAFSNLFKGCTSLVSAPELPATTLNEGCYYGMFWQCSSLTTAPTLPATTLTSKCYYYMFRQSSLSVAPTLSATSVPEYAYDGMFYNTKLVTAPDLPATDVGNYAYAHMFNRCNLLTTAPVMSGTTLGQYACQNMFDSCTSLVTAPDLICEWPGYAAYHQMFANCTKLKVIRIWAKKASSALCNNWLKSNNLYGTLYNYGGATFVSGVSGIPTKWTEIKV